MRDKLVPGRQMGKEDCLIIIKIILFKETGIKIFLSDWASKCGEIKPIMKEILLMG